MKRLISLFTILTGFLLSIGIYADACGQVRALTRPAPPGGLPTLEDDIKELRAFSAKIDQFIILINDQQWPRADFLKSSIIRDMKDEIHQTTKKMEAFRQNAENSEGSSNKRNTITTFRENDVYIKRNQYEYSHELGEIERRLSEQKSIMREFAGTRLGGGQGAWERSKKHERLMIRFEETLKEDVRQTKRNQGDSKK